MQQSDAGIDGDSRIFYHENIGQYGTDGSTRKKTHSNLPDERCQYGVLDTGKSIQFNKDEFSKEVDLELATSNLAVVRERSSHI